VEIVIISVHSQGDRGCQDEQEDWSAEEGVLKEQSAQTKLAEQQEYAKKREADVVGDNGCGLEGDQFYWNS